MTRPEIRSALADLLENICGEPLPLPADDVNVREGLNLDSLDLIALAAEIYDHFGVVLEIADVSEVATVGSLVDVLHAKLSTWPSSNQAA